MNELIKSAINDSAKTFEKIDEIVLHNQKKVLDAFAQNQVALRHFMPSTGYGTGDNGRDTLGKVVAQIFGTESAIMSPLIASGTHALTIALFGILRPNDIVLSVCGQPYDTLHHTIYGNGNGSLADFGIRFDCIDLLDDSQFDYTAIENFLQNNSVKMVYLQRSRGYAFRKPLSIEQIERICSFVHNIDKNIIVMCDNCYGEFVQKQEPTQVGVDICAGSCIKNVCAGLAPTGGYVCGRADLVDLVGKRLISPSVGAEIGSYDGGYRMFYQGLFLAPHTVGQVLKNVAIFSYALSQKGCEVLPKPNDDDFGDVVCSIKLGNEQRMVNFCKAIQAVSPVDSFVSPEPWCMPGYNDKVIMAAGAFVDGASIELSCDGPIRPPYTVYLQGGLTFEHGILALDKVLESFE